MSTVSLEDVKRDLRVIHDEDDLLLQQLIDSAEQECLRFLGRDSLPAPGGDDVSSSEDASVAPDVARGIVLMVRADYEEVDPLKRPQWRAAAEQLWMPYRQGLGV